MNHPQRTTEHSFKHDTSPIERADHTAAYLDVYPTQQAWLAFFDKTLLVSVYILTSLPARQFA